MAERLAITCECPNCLRLVKPIIKKKHEIRFDVECPMCKALFAVEKVTVAWMNDGYQA